MLWNIFVEDPPGYFIKNKGQFDGNFYNIQEYILGLQIEVGGTWAAEAVLNPTPKISSYVWDYLNSAPRVLDFTDSTKFNIYVAGSGNTEVHMGVGGGSIRLGTGDGTVFGGFGKDTITFGPGLGTVTGGLGGHNTFVFVKGEIADPTEHSGRYDSVTDFHGAGQAWSVFRDFIWLKGFGAGTTFVYERDLDGHADQHLYKVQDNGYTAEFVLTYAGAGVTLNHGQWNLL